ncbi:putative Ig domain-containing protein [Lysobacter sp. D1-1-M9]|uniref:putative Ig domain-containing protein n=1 Tax=Novilysobacter longmucuonensis TaxID=3098603 RepID=UPI002FC96841
MSGSYLCGALGRGFRVLGMLVLLALLLPSLAVAQTSPPSTLCPTLSMSVAHGASQTLNVDHCHTGFGIGTVGTAPAHGSVSIANFPSSITYTHVGGSNVATSDFFSVRDEDGNWMSVSVTIAAPTSAISIEPSTLPEMFAGTAFSQQLSATGGTAPYTYSITGGALPPGLTMTSAGLISGTPTQRGDASFTVGVVDAVSDTGSRGYTVSVAGGTLSVSPNPPPSGFTGRAYSQSFTASGGVAPYTLEWEADPGKPLPPGLSFSGTTLSGTPTTVGNYTFGIRVTDSSTGTGTWFQVVDVSMTVSAPPTITVDPATLPGATVGAAYSQTVTGGGGTAPYTFAVTAGALPAGLVLASTTGVISGTPTAGGSFNFTITATDADAFSGSRSYAFTVAAATVALAPATLPAATVGASYSQGVNASGGTAPYTYAVSAGALPAGLTLASDGSLTGTASAGGSFNFTVTATDSSTGTGPFTGGQAYAFTVSAPTVTIAPTTLPSATVGAAYSESITASGGTAPYTYAVTTGMLPAGLTLGSGGLLSGTATESGAFSFTVTATDSSTGTGPFNGSRAYSFTVTAPTVTVAPTTLPDAMVGDAYNETVTASGGTAPYVFTVTAGALPAGLNLASNGTLSGTPTAPGSSSFTVTATDSSGGTGPFAGSQAYSVAVTELAPVANPVSATVAYGSGANVIALDIGGGAPSSVAVASAATNGTAVASGTTISYQPDAGFSGTDSFTYTATNSAGTSAAAAVSITVSAPTITVSANDPLSTPVGTAYTQTFTWSGGAAPYSGYTVTGLPAGLVISASTTTSVTVSGTPTEAGTFVLAATATDSSTGSGPFAHSGDFSLQVTAATPVLSPAAGVLTAGYATAYSQIFSASGGVAPYTFSMSGALPAGLVFDTGSGTLSGTPTQSGSFPISVAVTDSSTGAGAPFSTSNAYTLEIAAPTLLVTPATLPEGTTGAAYSQTIAASGGVAPYTFSLSAGTLPAGLTLAADGDLAGTPTAAGTFNLDVTVSDSAATPSTTTRGYALVIGAPLITVAPSALADATAGAAYSQTFTASGGTGAYTFAVSAGALPAGLVLSTAGELTGTPTAPGDFGFNVTAIDSLGFGGSATYTLRVTQAAPVAADDSAETGAGEAVTVAVTANDEGDIDSIAMAMESSHGTAVVSGLAIIYTPAAGHVGSDSFKYRATGPGGTSGDATVTITIDAGAVPQGIAQALTTLAGQAVTLHAADGAGGGPFTGVTVVSAPAIGTLTIAGTELHYTPPADASGPVSVGYTLENAFGSSALITSTITVNPLPVPASSEVETVAGVPVQIELTTGATGGPFTGAEVVSLSPASSGTATIAASGSGASAMFRMTFAPAPDFTGTATVSFNLSNEFATSQAATVTINVAARPDPAADAEVLGVLNAQADTTRRFATAQIGNFQQRLRAMHDGGANGARFSNQLTFVVDRSCNDAVYPGSGRSCANARPADEQATVSESAAETTEATAFATWTGGALGSGDRDRRNGSSALSFETSGVSAGADYRATQAFAFGAGIGYGRDRTDVGENGSRSDGDSRAVALYASWHPGDALFLDGLVGYQWMSFDIHRHVAANDAVVQGERDGTQWFASISAGLDHHRGHLSVSPYARLDLSRARLDGYTELGDPLYALRYEWQDVDATTGNLGLDLDYRKPMSWGTFAPQLRLEYQHDFQGDGTATLRYADLLAGPVFRADLNGFDRNRFMMGFGAAFYLQRDLTLRLEYRSLFGSDDEQSLLFNLEKKY